MFRRKEREEIKMPLKEFKNMYFEWYDEYRKVWCLSKCSWSQGIYALLFGWKICKWVPWWKIKWYKES